MTELGLTFTAVNVAADPDERAEVMAVSGQTGVPVLQDGDKVLHRLGRDRRVPARHLSGAGRRGGARGQGRLARRRSRCPSRRARPWRASRSSSRRRASRSSPRSGGRRSARLCPRSTCSCTWPCRWPPSRRSSSTRWRPPRSCCRWPSCRPKAAAAWSPAPIPSVRSGCTASRRSTRSRGRSRSVSPRCSRSCTPRPAAHSQRNTRRLTSGRHQRRSRPRCRAASSSCRARSTGRPARAPQWYSGSALPTSTIHVGSRSSGADVPDTKSITNQSSRPTD